MKKLPLLTAKNTRMTSSLDYLGFCEIKCQFKMKWFFVKKPHLKLLEDCFRFWYSKTYINILSFTWNIPSSFQKLKAQKIKETNVRLKPTLASRLTKQFFCNLRLVIRDNARSLRLTETSGTRILFELQPVWIIYLLPVVVF